MIRTISSMTTDYHTHAIVKHDGTPGYVVNTYRVFTLAAPGEDVADFPLMSLDSLDDARREIERRADVDVQRSRDERGMVAWAQTF